MVLWVVDGLGDSDFSRPEAQETQGVRDFTDGRTTDREAALMGTRLCTGRVLWDSLGYDGKTKRAVCAKGMDL